MLLRCGRRPKQTLLLVSSVCRGVPDAVGFSQSSTMEKKKAPVLLLEKPLEGGGIAVRSPPDHVGPPLSNKGKGVSEEERGIGSLHDLGTVSSQARLS